MTTPDQFPKMFTEFPRESEFDVIVKGGGPNGPMAAAYLPGPTGRTMYLFSTSAGNVC